MDKTIFETHWKHALELCPSFENAGIKSDVCGPESFTPDHKPLIGEDPIVVGKIFLFRHSSMFRKFKYYSLKKIKIKQLGFYPLYI